jgi:hypothetical protein
MSIAGHVSRATLSRYSHVRMEGTRRPSMRSPPASAPWTRSGSRQPGCNGLLRRLLNQRWFSNTEASAIDEGVACQRLWAFYESTFGQVSERW